MQILALLLLYISPLHIEIQSLRHTFVPLQFNIHDNTVRTVQSDIVQVSRMELLCTRQKMQN